MKDDVRRSRTAFVWVGVIVPLAIILITTVIVATWLPELPDPIAIHWGSEGVDGYGPKWMAIVLPLGVGGGLVAFMTLIGVSGHRMPQSSTKSQVQPWGSTSRFLGGMNLGLALLFAFISLVMTGVQRGITDAAQAPDIAGAVWIAFGLLVVGAAVGWFLQPRSPEPTGDAGAAGEDIELGETERAAWFGTAAMARPGIITLIVAVLLLIITTAWVFGADPGTGWIMATVTLLVVLLVVVTLVFRVRVNAEGLRVRSIAGWPRWNIPAADISDVRVVSVNPMGEFGGWGLRIAVDGRMGIVLRTGEGLQVTRHSGRRFVITIDDAATAASVLNSAAKGAQS
ncbi:DUF1648 domain-containing protein [Microbacterium sp. A204]|uniref:DUF1648 domain-containing protein n=1 Tax=Microbacterium sp. A204 TaxID=3457321 RepID=UPI003FD149D0